MTTLSETFPRTLSLKPAALLCLAMLVVMIGLIANLPFVVMAIAVLIALVALVADKSLGTLFLVVTCFHATLSYLSVALAGTIGGNKDANIANFAPEAYKVYFFGIVAMLIAYGLTPARKLQWSPATVSPEKLRRLSLWFTAAGVLLILYVLKQVGFVEMIVSGTFSRYFGEEQAGPNFAFYQSLLRRGLAVLAITIPILLLLWQQSKSKLLLVAAMAGLLAMASTTRRGGVAIAVLAFVTTNAVIGRHRKAIAVTVLLLVVGFFSLQAMFININTGSDSVVENTAFVLRSASTEVNDLAWVLSEWNHHWYWGATWLAGVWPLPSTVSSFKDNYNLASVTKDVAGIPREAESGGLRISMFGEAYLNLGYLGVVGLGLIFGVLVRKTNSLIDWAKSQGPLVLFPFVFFYMVALCQFYLSGTGTVADAILSCLVLAAIYWLAMRRPQAVQAA